MLAIKTATKNANTQIYSYAAQHLEYRGMGTTATVAGLLGDTLYLAQVGDSRAYVVRRGIARQITKDQSLMQKLVEAGELTEEEAEHSERRNIILQALGPEQNIRVDLTHQTVRRGDTLVICSDGLSSQVGKDAIAEVVTEQDDIEIACQELIDLANAKGGPDNITVILARFEGSGLFPPADTDEVGHQVFPLPTNLTPTEPIDAFDIDPRIFPTEEMEALGGIPRQRDRRSGGRAGAASPAAIVSGGMLKKYTPQKPQAPEPPPPVVSDARRSTGRTISIGLLGLLIVGALWFLYHWLTAATSERADSVTADYAEISVQLC